MSSPKNPFDPDFDQPQATGQRSVDRGVRNDGAGSYDPRGPRTSRSGGLDRNQGIEKKYRDGETRKPVEWEPAGESNMSEGEKIRAGLVEPMESRNPGEPPSGADNTAPNETYQNSFE